MTFQMISEPHLSTSTSTAPWWGVPLVSGGFILLGVIVTQFISYRMEQARAAREELREVTRQKREDQRRFDKELREVYGKFFRVSRQLSVCLFRSDPESFAQSRRLFAELEPVYQELLVIGHPPVTLIGGRLFGIAQVACVDRTTREQLLKRNSLDAEAWSRNCYSFMAEARLELGLEPFDNEESASK